MKKKLFLAGSAFMLAIGGAFASHILVADLGYSKQADVQTPGGVQEALCAPREECDGGQFACTASFQEGSVIYSNIQLYKLAVPDNTTTCTIELNRSIP